MGMRERGTAERHGREMGQCRREGGTGKSTRPAVERGTGGCERETSMQERGERRQACERGRETRRTG